MTKSDFASKTTYGLGITDELVWTEEARARLNYIPSFVRGMVSQRVENHAREQGLTEITADLMHKVRQESLGGRIGNVPSFVRKMLAARSED